MLRHAVRVVKDAWEERYFILSFSLLFYLSLRGVVATMKDVL